MRVLLSDASRVSVGENPRVLDGFAGSPAESSQSRDLTGENPIPPLSEEPPCVTLDMMY